jgi:hypothetical protein
MMRKTVVEVGRVPSGIDGSTFFAPTIPEEVRAAAPLLCEYPGEIVAGIIKMMSKYIALGNKFSLPSKLYSSEISPAHLNLMLTATYFTLRQAVRSKAKLSTVRHDLSAMRLPATFTEGICNELYQSRMALEGRALTNRLHFAKLQKLRWRVDVAISSGSLSRVMRPTILMQVSSYPIRCSGCVCMCVTIRSS